MLKPVHTSEAPKARGPYSQGVLSGGFIFVSGQGPVDPKTNEFVLGDIQSEARLTLSNIKAILEAGGSSLRHVVRVSVFLADLNDFNAMNEVYREFFPEDPPARTTVGVQLPKIRVEIDCIAQV
jgi:2-iminobutanoate/2-iminopropanoate deaminase